MPCIVTNGRELPCKSGVGGLKNVFFGPYSTVTAALTDSSGTITLTDSETFYEYHIKGNSSLETAINSSRENGTTFYESTLNLTFTFLDVATQEQIKLLAHSRPQIVVEDYNGNFFLVGKDHGCEVTGGTVVTGAAMGDLSGFTLTFTAQETAPPFFCAAAPTDDSTSPIDPTP
jgi:heme/copper-type cytochrome/quinol oxidase subunit 3|tara:strand:- start:166 stop:687 length:522 start_codon:yes stop_codon:yes gene_type:complete